MDGDGKHILSVEMDWASYKDVPWLASGKDLSATSVAGNIISLMEMSWDPPESVCGQSGSGWKVRMGKEKELKTTKPLPKVSCFSTSVNCK